MTDRVTVNSRWRGGERTAKSETSRVDGGHGGIDERKDAEVEEERRGGRKEIAWG